MTQTFKCKYCGKLFEREKGKGAPSYCSRKCSREGFKTSHQNEITDKNENPPKRRVF